MRADQHQRHFIASFAAALLAAACAAPGSAGPAAAAPAAASGDAGDSAAPRPATHAVKPLPLPAPTDLEQRYGLQIAQLALTASGGLVDVRFKVLDPAKVKSLLADATHPPMLIAGDKPPLMPPHHALKGARFAQGQVFYILYPNLRGAVQPGGEVTVAIGDVRLGPVKAQ